jgi:hypothetical protein
MYAPTPNAAWSLPALSKNLYQGNYKADDGWQLWQDELSENAKDGGKGLLAFLASYAAKQQNDVFTKFRLTMFKNYHDKGIAYSLENLLSLAEKTGLDKERFEQDLKSQAARKSLEKEHNEALNKNISATPTFCFQSGAAAYFRFKTLPQTRNDAIQFFLDYRKMIETYPDLETIRRPYKR